MTDQTPMLPRPPLKTEYSFWPLLLISSVAGAAALVMVVIAWVPDNYKCLPCAYNPEAASCHGFSRDNPALKDVCGYEGNTEQPCIQPITSIKPLQCFGIVLKK